MADTQDSGKSKKGFFVGMWTLLFIYVPALTWWGTTLVESTGGTISTYKSIALGAVLAIVYCVVLVHGAIRGARSSE